MFSLKGGQSYPQQKGGMKYVSRNFTYFDIDFNIFENNKNFKRHNKIAVLVQKEAI